jgi:hypothetical protein
MPIERAYAFTDLFSLVRAGSAWRFDAAGTLTEVAANQPRVDYDPATLAARGLLLEEGATNRLLNARQEGAAAGSPGTVPSGSGFISATATYNLTRSMTVGVESGLPYVEYRWVGTANATNDLLFNLQSPDAAAASGQAWTLAVHCVLAGAALPTSATLRLSEANASVFSATDVSIPLGAAPLRQARRTVTRTFTDGSTNGARPVILVRVTNGVAYDFTIRMAAPQLWQSALAFSPSFPPAGTPGASVRAADDLAVLDLGTWFSLAAGTFVIDWTPAQDTSPANRGLIMLDDGTANNRMQVFMQPGGTAPRLFVRSGGVVSIAGLSSLAVPAPTRRTLRFSYGPAGYFLSVDGSSPVTLPGALPLELNRCLLGANLPGSEYLNGWLGPRLTYYPVQYTDVAAEDGFTIRTR